MVNIVKVSAQSQQVQNLIRKLDQLMYEMYKEFDLEQGDSLDAYLDDICELDKPNVVFLGAQNQDGNLIGIGAIKNLEKYSELKRVYVEQQYRGQGVADKLISELEKYSSHDVIKLETGTKQVAAINLFMRLGYKVCEHYGCYGQHPASVYMEKRLKNKEL